MLMLSHYGFQLFFLKTVIKFSLTKVGPRQAVTDAVRSHTVFQIEKSTKNTKQSHSMG